MKRHTRSASNGDIPPADLETNMEKSDDGSPKKVKKRGKHSLIKDYLVDYTSNSNLHGLKYIGEKERTFVEKIFWIFMFTCCVVLCAGLIAKVYKKWNESPVIVSFAENPMPVFKIPYPAVTVCFETKAMQSKYNFTKYYHLYNGSETYGNLTDQEGIDTVNTLKEVCPNITETFFGCKWKDVNKDYCSDLFSPILTEEGICYTFNTLGADHLLRQEKLHTDYQYLDFAFGENLTTPWTLENGYPDDTPIETYPHRGSGYGAKAGLSFVLMATEVDLDYLCRGPVQGYKVELPRLSQQYFRAPLSQEVVVAVKPKMMTTSEGLLPYSPETRQCYFPSERYLQYFKVYTQANCEMECLSNFTYIRCGCVHFGMLYGPNMTVCNAGSIECVQKAQMEMVTVAAQTSLNKDDTNGNEVNNTLRLARDVALRCKCKPTYMTRIFIFFKEAQFITSRRSELYGQTDFLANCGGLLGLFMGFSFLSVVEIIYFLTLRLWCALWKKKSKKRVADENQTKTISAQHIEKSVIEHLPQELRDRFTEMREMDLSVQNSMDTLEKRVRTLFGGCRKGEIETEQANTEFADIKRGYNKTIEEADEKVALANQMSELVDRYLRRLDTELHKFKCELEADNKGITELLEKRSLELDVNTNHTSTSNNNHYKENSWGSREARAVAAGGLSRTDSAIQMQHGRRTAAMKSTYEAVAGAELHAHQALHAKSYSTTLAPSHSQQVVAPVASRSSSPTVVMNNVVNNVAIEEPMEEEWTYDPNEPRYCICNQVSYGDMVACDNQDCPYEWFHYPCVGITAPPKGKWYCPQCQTNMRRNRARKN
ncbi:hypothetical protein MSG28_013193 [Choristoneura fumiferana]|uniref:Uncharacterized protein n=1 Tax=Choristoneura fumiferana TaxID=7141 RepID=A0ACC0KSE5_CHOFU|nr:hypothetical protein MSG28_013193 [Choristoneura fumiferana]